MKITPSTARSLREYIYEYVVLAMVAAVSILFYLYVDLNKFVRTDLQQDKYRMEQVIERNTVIIENIKK